MRPNEVYLRSVAAWLPGTVDVSEAVADGRYAATACDDDDYSRICIEPDLAAAEMAVEAAKNAVSDSGASIALVFHSSIWFQGASMWPAASFVAAQAGAPSAVAFDLQQQCNAGLAGIELASRLLDGPGRPGGSFVDGDVLVTSADRFSGTSIDRWSTESGVVYADGAAAAVLSRGGGALRIVSTSTSAANPNEVAVRGEALTPEPDGSPLRLQDRFDHFARTGAIRPTVRNMIEAVAGSVKGALRDADTSMDELAGIVVPATGRTRFAHLLAATGIDIDRTNWHHVRTIGHLGVSDQLAGLACMIEEKEPAPGDRFLLLGGGAGFTCTSVVLEWTGDVTGSAAVTITGAGGR